MNDEVSDEIPDFIDLKDMKGHFILDGKEVFVTKNGIFKKDEELVFETIKYDDLKGWKTKKEWRSLEQFILLSAFGLIFLYGVWSHLVYLLSQVPSYIWTIVGIVGGLSGLWSKSREIIWEKVLNVFKPERIVVLKGTLEMEFPLPPDDEDRKILFSNLLKKGEGEKDPRFEQHAF